MVIAHEENTQKVTFRRRQLGRKTDTAYRNQRKVTPYFQQNDGPPTYHIPLPLSH